MKATNVTEIRLFDGDKPIGIGRVWEERGQFRWAHPLGFEGAEDTFAEAVRVMEAYNGEQEGK